ncbi:hypothetical protein [Nitrobacter winogradskyi]|uniref:Uncharacterized protein n=1 Tax=Nitrobacter winogradskyi TaxID=913 RepID=A0ACC6APK1_NITWI|nr:hypothetical protein [Nitrobacter winogradskyi]MCP2000810.1 hypothetical protein [Nitrobacter winogradskyi]
MRADIIVKAMMIGIAFAGPCDNEGGAGPSFISLGGEGRARLAATQLSLKLKRRRQQERARLGQTQLIASRRPITLVQDVAQRCLHDYRLIDSVETDVEHLVATSQKQPSRASE